MGNFVRCEFCRIGEFSKNAQICVLRPVADRRRARGRPSLRAGAQRVFLVANDGHGLDAGAVAVPLDRLRRPLPTASPRTAASLRAIAGAWAPWSAFR